jgi:hypothetical protein
MTDVVHDFPVVGLMLDPDGPSMLALHRRLAASVACRQGIGSSNGSGMSSSGLALDCVGESKRNIG